MDIILKGDYDKKEINTNQTLKKVIIISSAIASMSVNPPDYSLRTNEEDKDNLKKEYYEQKSLNEKDKIERLHYTEQSKTESIKVGSTDQVYYEINADKFTVNVWYTGNILSNKEVNKNSNKQTTTDNIYDGIKEDSKMQQLISHRDTVEKTGVFTGIALGSIVLLPSLFFLIDWGSTIPTSILFFSLSIFITIRRRTRSRNNGDETRSN